MVGRDGQEADAAFVSSGSKRAGDIVRAGWPAISAVEGCLCVEIGALVCWCSESKGRLDGCRRADGVLLGRYGRIGRLRSWRTVCHFDYGLVGVNSRRVDGDGRSVH